MIPPAAQRAMAERAGATSIEVAGSHSVHVSQPRAVADLITDAARSVWIGWMPGSAPHLRVPGPLRTSTACREEDDPTG